MEKQRDSKLVQMSRQLVESAQKMECEKENELGE
jgi:hypothetical protein